MAPPPPPPPPPRSAIPLPQPARILQGAANVLPTPTHGAGSGLLSFTVACSARVAAPPRACLAVVLDAPAYEGWNAFVPRVRATSTPGERTGGEEGEGEEKEEALRPPTGPGFLALGTQMTFEVHMDCDPRSPGPRDTHLAVTALEPLPPLREQQPSTSGSSGGDGGWRVCWATRPGAIPGFALRSERVQEFVAAGDGNGNGNERGHTDYYCWETFYGPLAPAVRLAVGAQLERGFQVWAEGMAREAEARAAAAAGGEGQ